MYRRLSQTEFSEAYRNASSHVLDGAVARMWGSSTEALDTLQQLLTDGSEHVHYLSASKLLALAVRTDVDELAQRVETLEEANAPQAVH